jgi:hypothetical protein
MNVQLFILAGTQTAEPKRNVFVRPDKAKLEKIIILRGGACVEWPISVISFKS